MTARRAGFTLLELIVALAIIGLITALVAPVMIRSSAKESERRALNEVVNLLTARRIDAIDGGARQRVVLTPAEGALIAASPGGGRTWTDWPVTLLDEEGEPAQSIRFEFDARGRAEIRSLRFAGAEGSDRIWIIRFDPVSGTPTLERGGETTP